jgi:hypothetical protein
VPKTRHLDEWHRLCFPKPEERLFSMIRTA